MEDYLPKESGRYLKVILGNLNVSILDRDTKCNYKEQYEQFKLTINIIGILDYINLIGIICWAINSKLNFLSIQNI